MKKFKKMDCGDICLIKLGIVAAVLFLITVWPWLHTLVMSIHWGWYLGAVVIFALRPIKRACLCCK